jgi:uncharacterized protein (DUF58 family)
MPSVPDRSAWTFRLTTVGQAWLTIGVSLLGIGLFKNINLLVLLGDALLAAAALDALALIRPFVGLSARRRIGLPVSAGVAFPVQVRLSNGRRGVARGMQILDAGPEHECVWFAAAVASRETITFRAQVTLSRRGRYAWGPLWVTTGFPFGLFERRSRLLPAEESLVLPRIGKVHRSRLLRRLRGGAPPRERHLRRPRPHAAAQAEVHGLRPFRVGDSPRAIHWRTSARRGELMVREYEDAPGDELLLVFDPTRPEPKGAALVDFEAAVSLAASVAREWCRRAGDRLVLAIPGTGAVVLDGAAGPGHLQRVLEALALVCPEEVTAPGPWIETLTALPGAPPAVLLIGGPSSGALAATLRQRLRRPVTLLEGASDAEDFYEPPEVK